jgi:hypothetical protein
LGQSHRPADEYECESFIDATFASAKGGDDGIGKIRRGKGVRIIAIVDRHGMALSVSTHAADHREATLVQLSFDVYMLEAKRNISLAIARMTSDGLERTSSRTA